MLWPSYSVVDLRIYIRVMCRGKNIIRNKIIFCTIFFVTVVIALIIYIAAPVHALDCTFSGQLDEAKKIIKDQTGCINNYAEYSAEKKDNFIVLYNYVIASNRYSCEDSVTYVTNADFTFIGHLKHVVQRWQGPVSVALHAPGTDFDLTLESIGYVRNCLPGVKEFVTFHIYFNSSYAPRNIPPPELVLDSISNCSLPAPYEKIKPKDKFVRKNNILYPINVGRNIALRKAETHFVLVADIELYPSLNLIPDFMKLMAGCLGRMPTLSVFVLEVFEIESNLQVPNNKMQLKELLKKKLAVAFHSNICSECHAVPNHIRWVLDKNYQGLKLFYSAKRNGQYHHWEPFYLGTKKEPPFDERLSWEGMSDKIVQAYTMCLMDYTFYILDNAFLVHSPGIKREINPIERFHRKKYVNMTNECITDVILPELYRTYGNDHDCIF